MWSLVVIVMDPSSQGEFGVVNGHEAPVPAELLLEGFDEHFAESVLLGRVWGELFLS